MDMISYIPAADLLPMRVFGIDLKIKKLTYSELFLEVPGRIELP